jgi:hypothetical protein
MSTRNFPGGCRDSFTFFIRGQNVIYICQFSELHVCVMICYCVIKYKIVASAVKCDQTKHWSLKLCFFLSLLGSVLLILHVCYMLYTVNFQLLDIQASRILISLAKISKKFYHFYSYSKTNL